MAQRRGAAPRDPRHLRRHARASGSRCCAGRCWPPPAAGTLEVQTPEGDQVWTEVRQFAESGPEDLHYRLDHVAGEVQFGPAVRLADGTLRHYGAVPPRGSTSSLLTSYRSGGGRRGNVTAGQVRVLKTSVPYVARVENRAAAVGGSDAETLDGRQGARPDAAPGARARRDRGGLRPAGAGRRARGRAGALRRQPRGRPGRGCAGAGRAPTSPATTWAGSAATTSRRRRGCSSGSPRRSTRCRLVGTRVLVAPPHYTGLTVVADVHARERFDADVVHDDVLRALYGLLDPLTGGPDGDRLAVRPVGAVPRGARRAGPDPRRRHGPGGLGDAVPGRRRHAAGVESPVQRLDLPPTGLVFSYEHQVRVR